MPRDPVYVEPNQLVEVVIRTAGGRFLLRPSRVVNTIILSVLARALELFGIQLHAFAFLSNHGHLMLSVPDAERLSGFVGHLKRNIGRGVRRVLGWDFNVWSGRTRAIPILDDAAAIARLRYILSHGAKEGLVASPLDWPGATAARALVGREVLVGEWTDGRAACEDRRRREKRGTDACTRRIPIRLAPLPCWAHLSKAEYEARCAQLIAEIEEESLATHPRPLGPEAVLATEPLALPEASPMTPRPRAHASCPSARRSFLARREGFLAAYREASKRLRAGVPTAFPPGSFPPRGRFVPFTPAHRGPQTGPAGLSVQ